MIYIYIYIYISNTNRNNTINNKASNTRTHTNTNGKLEHFLRFQSKTQNMIFKDPTRKFSKKWFDFFERRLKKSSDTKQKVGTSKT